MIVVLARSAARSLFTISLLFGFAAFLALYGAYRLLRFVTVGAPAQPRQRAAFDLLMAIVTLARAMKVQAPQSDVWMQHVEQTITEFDFETEEVAA